MRLLVRVPESGRRVTDGFGWRRIASLVIAVAAAVGNAGFAPPAGGAVGGQTLARVWPIGANTLWAFTEAQTGATAGAQGLELTTDGGKRWTNVAPSDCLIGSVFALSQTRAWLTCGNTAKAFIESTGDGGRHWAHTGVLPVPAGNCSLQFASPEVGWCTVMDGAAGSMVVAIYRTGDGGTSWKRIFTNFSQVAKPKVPAGSLPFMCDKDIEFASPTRGWALFACNGGLAPLYETFDGGVSWVCRGVARPPGSLDAGSYFQPKVQQFGKVAVVGLQVGAHTVVYASTDGAATFHPVVIPGTPRYWTVDTVSATSWRLVAGNHVLATDNGAKSWSWSTSNVKFNLLGGYGSPTPPAVDFATLRIGWVVETSSIWRTTDGGHEWLKVAVPGTGKA
jgi:photosystem II stability/assembly factor-like uncharacterized protein